jgi:hypothetical protein
MGVRRSLSFIEFLLVILVLLGMQQVSAQGFAESAAVPKCEEEAKRVKGLETQRNVVRLRCERERLISSFQQNSALASVALREYLGAGESLFSIRQRLVSDDQARCPAPGVRNEAIPLCKSLQTDYEAQIKKSWDDADRAAKQAASDARNIVHKDQELSAELKDLDNYLSMKYFVLATFVGIMV